MEPLRIGYIGAGGFTNRFMFPQLSRHAVELVAVCDIDEPKARRAQAQYGFQHVYTDFHAMCDEQRLDAVFCVGGPRVHHDVGMQILERGLPLYVQKPPALTAALTREMADLARKKNVVCHVGFNIRSSAAVQRAKQIMAAEAFGRPSLCIVRYGFIAGRTYQDAVLDQHCHAVDTLRYLMGEVESLHVTAGRLAGLRHYVVGVTFASGSVGTLNFTSEQGGREFFYFEVTGEKGNLLTSHQFGLRYRHAAAPRTDAGPDQPDEIYETSVWGGEDQIQWMGYTGDVANFLAAVRGEAADRSPVASTIATIEGCEEIYRQLEALGVAG